MRSRTSRADAELKKGSAELLILSLVEDQPRHGYDICKLIELRSRGALRFKVASLYPLLYRLERRGWSHGRAAIGATLGATFGVIAIVTLTIVALAGPVEEMVQSAVAGADSVNDAVAGNAR